jgi:hypothetical protein
MGASVNSKWRGAAVATRDAGAATDWGTSTYQPSDLPAPDRQIALRSAYGSGLDVGDLGGLVDALEDARDDGAGADLWGSIVTDELRVVAAFLG